MPDQGERWTLLYDADCSFCRWSLDRILAWDRNRRLRPLPLQTEEAARLSGGMDEHTRMASWHLVSPEGRVWSGGAAVAPLARLLPFGAPVAMAADALPSTTERAYRWVVANRGRLGRLVGGRRRS